MRSIAVPVVGGLEDQGVPVRFAVIGSAATEDQRGGESHALLLPPALVIARGLQIVGRLVHLLLHQKGQYPQAVALKAYGLRAELKEALRSVIATAGKGWGVLIDQHVDELFLHDDPEGVQRYGGLLAQDLDMLLTCGEAEASVGEN